MLESLFLFPRELGWREDRWQLKAEILSCLYTYHKRFLQGPGDRDLSLGCWTDAYVLHSWHGALVCPGFGLLAAVPACPTTSNSRVTGQTFLAPLGSWPAVVHGLPILPGEGENADFCVLFRTAHGFCWDCRACGWYLWNCISAGTWIPVDHTAGQLE